MRSEKFKEFKEEGHHRGGRHRGRDGSHQRGAKTFRRGRAIALLEIMNLKLLIWSSMNSYNYLKYMKVK